MKTMQNFSRLNLFLLMLATVLAGALLFAGCNTMDYDDSSAPDHLDQQESCL